LSASMSTASLATCSLTMATRLLGGIRSRLAAGEE
jgi:hypothetical protein